MLAWGLLWLVTFAVWADHALLRARAGRPMTWQIHAAELSPADQKRQRIVTNLCFAAVLLAYPLLRGHRPLEYYSSLLPGGRYVLDVPLGFSLAILYLGILYLAWLLTGNVQIRPVERPGRAATRLAALPFSAFAGATLEELLFRGMLLANLLETFPAAFAIPLGAAIFASAHYVRRVKRYWTIPGHVVLGVVLCIAFACTRTLWLPIGLHAGGIFITLGIRSFVRSTGPAWLVGASIFPYAGVAGLLGLTLLTANVWLLYGGIWGM